MSYGDWDSRGAVWSDDDDEWINDGGAFGPQCRDEWMRFVVVDLIYDEEFLDARQRAFASVSGDEVPTAKFGVMSG
jgi:hypothetical protein